MTQVVPAFHFNTAGLGSANFFSTQLAEILELDDLVACFHAASSLQGALSHACFAVETSGRCIIFGDPEMAGYRARGEVMLITHPVFGWDEQPYEVDLLLSPGVDATQVATLKAMASLYLSHGLTLLEAREGGNSHELTANERFCREQYGAGLCLLDIAEALHCSVHAVSIYLARAHHKQR